MKLIRDRNNLHSRRLNGCVVTLGNFDGIHLGHQQLLQLLNTHAKKLALPAVVVTFEPQPKEFFTKSPRLPRLMRFREKWLALKNKAIDYVLCLRFNQSLADVSAEKFVTEILVKQLQAKVVLVGDDFRFGAKRTGDFNLLKKMGEQYGFQAMDLATVTFANERVSSTRVREALQAGNMSLATQLLNRPYTLHGRVIPGDQRGRTWGFPTANIHLNRQAVPLAGIFVVTVRGIGNRAYQGVASVGVRPMFPSQRPLLEVYLFDFDGDLYGRRLEVAFLHQLRQEMHFDSVDALIAQIQQDVLAAKNYFLTHPQ